MKTDKRSLLGCQMDWNLKCDSCQDIRKDAESIRWDSVMIRSMVTGPSAPADMQMVIDSRIVRAKLDAMGQAHYSRITILDTRRAELENVRLRKHLLVYS